MSTPPQIIKILPTKNGNYTQNVVFCLIGIYEKILEVVGLQGFALICQIFCGADGARTRDPRRDRPVF